MGDIEYGKCDICKVDAALTRKYYTYEIKCECCNGPEDNHFEIVRHCDKCEPKPPRTVKVWLQPIKE